MNKIIKIVLFFAAGMVLLFALVELIIILFGNSIKPVKSDCIIILGCSVYGNVPSPFLKARLDEGIRLYNEGYSRYIIVSGGKGKGENITEAEAMRDYLLDKGVDISSIIMEDKANSTLANITFSQEKMKEHNLSSAIIVSNKFHLLRAVLTAKKLGIKTTSAGVFVTQYKIKEVLGYIREVPALIKYYIME